MQLRHIRYFVAVAEAGSFVGAGRRLHVAQPSLSKLIADLEREVGCELLERGPRGVQLTPAGRAFLTEARLTLEAASRAVAAAQSAHEGTRRPLHFASARLTQYPRELATLLTKFRDHHPETPLQLHRMSERRQRVALRSHRIDVAVTWTPSLPVQGFQTMALTHSSIDGVLLPAKHPLAEREVVSLQDLSGMTRLHLPRRLMPELYARLRAALLERGLKPTRQRAQSLDVMSVSLALAAGDAYALLGSALAPLYTHENDAVVWRPFVEDPIPVWLALFWREGEPSGAVQKLLDIATTLSPPQPLTASSPTRHAALP